MGAIAVAVLTEDRERCALLEHQIDVARVVLSHVGFPQGATDPVLRRIQDQRAEVALIDLNP